MLKVSEGVRGILEAAPAVVIPEDRTHLLNLASGWGQSVFKVDYEVEGMGLVEEATVTRCKNGVSVNFNDVYMRRRDPDCMAIGDDKLTDKRTFKSKYGKEFGGIRLESYEWLKKQELIVMPFLAGDEEYGYPALLVCPTNAGFFAAGLADLQGFIPKAEISDPFVPKAIIFVAPTFRHSHFEGKQVVVHNRTEDVHEIFAYNLYPGPSAKKGVYGVLLNIGEAENWTTVHASCIILTTPYDNTLTIMHEGASGGGKSEMLEEIHREPDGSILFARNIINNERIKLEMADTCEISPVTD
ncbi:MAG TPA: DUF4914 family protein, partial [Clostridia bacterium]|nr:DUF4914 family protein [Clostridia bacterium]